MIQLLIYNRLSNSKYDEYLGMIHLSYEAATTFIKAPNFGASTGIYYLEDTI